MKRLFLIRQTGWPIALILIALTFSCKKTDPTLPTVTTAEITGKTANTALCGGEVTDGGGSAVTERGVCWSITQGPTLANPKTSNGTGTGAFISELTGLTPKAVYYVRAFATNAGGTAYGNEISFVSDSLGTGGSTFTDPRDSITYRIQIIGSQTWMAQNLAYLPAVSKPITGSDTLRNYYVYGYDSTILTEAKITANYLTYGVLYNWHAARVACPAGWHLPSIADWEKLINTVGVSPGGKLKETGSLVTDTDTTHWQTPNTGATNVSGFTALPGGERYSLSNDSTLLEKFRYINLNAAFWSSAPRDGSNAWAWHLYYNQDAIKRDWFSNANGFSVRCLKD